MASYDSACSTIKYNEFQRVFHQRHIGKIFISTRFYFQCIKSRFFSYYLREKTSLLWRPLYLHTVLEHCLCEEAHVYIK